MSVLIVGVSTRAAAESAARAGFQVLSIDAFQDLDQHQSVHAVPLRDGFSAAKATEAARDIECEAVVYLASFENHPDVVRVLASGRTLWGNTPEVLAQVRDPAVFETAFRRRGHAVPRVRMAHSLAGPGTEDGSWLIKPLAQGGGHGVRPWTPGEGLPLRCYLQERVDGVPGSVVFVAAAGRAVTLGVSRQLIGEEAFGASGYRYCGSILTLGVPGREEDVALADAASRLADSAAGAFGLVGVNGIDFVAQGGVPQPVEVNPRWCASMELIERARGISVFAAHAAACSSGELFRTDSLDGRPGEGAIGKAVVFARCDVTVGDTRDWLEAEALPGIRDVPHPGECIRAGRPVCTVFAHGVDEETCRAGLVEQARSVYGQLARWEREMPSGRP